MQTGRIFWKDPSYNEAPNLTDSEGGEEDIEDFVGTVGIKFPPKVTKVLSKSLHERYSGKYTDFKDLEAPNITDGESEESDSDIEDLVQSIKPEIPLIHSKRKLENACNSDEEDSVTMRKSGWFSGKRPFGLKGGAAYTNQQQERNNDLRLINNKTKGTANICFVNSTLQFLKVTGFFTFILSNLPVLLVGTAENSLKGCKSLFKIYSQQTTREASAASVRRCVAQHSGKTYLNDGTQQDASEFLRSLLAMLSAELATSEVFDSVQRDHWGSEKEEKFS